MFFMVCTMTSGDVAYKDDASISTVGYVFIAIVSVIASVLIIGFIYSYFMVSVVRRTVVTLSNTNCPEQSNT